MALLLALLVALSFPLIANAQCTTSTVLRVGGQIRVDAVGCPAGTRGAALKAALDAFTRSVAVELGPHDITVNAIAPGPVQTGYITSELDRQLVPAAIPLRRTASPDDIADMVVISRVTRRDGSAVR